MNYKDEIIRMIQEISNERYLKKIYYYVTVPYDRDKKEREGEHERK